MLQLPADGSDRLRTEQFVEGHVFEQVLQQVAVDRQLLQLLLSLGRIPLVHVRVDEVVQQAFRHRRRRGRLDHDHLDIAAPDVGEDFFEVRQVHHVLQTVAVGFGNDGEVVELAHHLEQVASAQALQPEGRALSPPDARQQQCAGRVLAEVRAEDRRIGQFAQDALAGLRRSHVGYDVQREFGLVVQQAQQDAVIVRLQLDLVRMAAIRTRPLAQRARQR